MTIDESVEEALTANIGYLTEIEGKYRTKHTKETSYKLSRKRAFLAMGDLNAAFQRMTQEPKSRQKYFSELYDIVVLANTFLSSLASLGTFVRTHKTTAISTSVATFFVNILDNLRNANQLLLDEVQTNRHEEHEIESARVDLENKYKKLSKNYDKILVAKEDNQQDTDRLSLELQEAKLIIEQLSYLFTLSENTIQRIKNIQTER